MTGSSWSRKSIKGGIVGVLMAVLTAGLGCRTEPPPQSARSGVPEPHPLADAVEGFHWLSYQAGIMVCAAEFVGCGAKKLALSPTYTEDELALVIDMAKSEAEKNGIPIEIENDLLVTKLFSPDVARGKTVILFAYDHDVLAEYHTLKAFRAVAEAGGRLDEVEEEIARRFGRLLSYSERTILRLLSESGRKEE